MEENTQEKKKSGMHGCLKGCLIFLGVVVLAVAVVVGIVYHKRGAIKTWAVTKMFDTIETGIMENLPEDVDEEKVRETMNRLETAIIDGKFAAERVEQILPEFERAMEDNRLDADEIKYLLGMINEAIDQSLSEVESSPELPE